MSDTLSSQPIHELKSSDRLKIALERLPPMPFDRPHVTEFDVLDSIVSKVLVTQWAVDDSADKPAEGIGGFFNYFQHGLILPDGDVLVGNTLLGWRMAVLEYHAGWYVTILNGNGNRPPTFSISPELWAEMLGSLERPSMRSEALRLMMTDGVAGKTYKELLTYVHSMHRRTIHRLNPHETSFVFI